MKTPQTATSPLTAITMKKNYIFNQKLTEKRVIELQEKWNNFNLGLPITYFNGVEHGENLTFRSYTEAWNILWKDADQEAKDWLTSLPEFNAEVFKKSQV